MGSLLGVAAIGVAAAIRFGDRWWEDRAALDLDFAGNRFWWNGRQFASLGAFLNAVGGALVGGRVTFPWTDASVQIRVDALVAEHPTGNEVLYSLDDGTETNCLRVRRDLSSQVVRVFAIANGTTLSDIGTMAAGRGWAIRSSQSAQSKTFHAAVNGAGSTANVVAAALPTVTTFRLGTGAQANLPWSGTIRRLTIFPHPATIGSKNIAASAVPHDLWLEGDSYVAGAQGVGLSSSLARLTNYTPVNQGIGGSNLEQIATRVAETASSTRRLPLVLWDGDTNDFGSLPDDLSRFASIVGAADHARFLIVAPAPRSGQSAAQQAATRALAEALLAEYGNRAVDPMPVLAALADPVTDDSNLANGTVPASLLQDGVHLTGAAMDAVGRLVSDRLNDLGWFPGR